MRRPPRSAIAAFTARPEKCSLRVRVLVFDTLAELRAYVRSTGRQNPGRCWGVSIGERVETIYTGRDRRRAGRARRLRPEGGEILFARRHLWAHVIVHECTHTALNMAERLKVDPREAGELVAGYMLRDSGNERFCYLMGSLVNNVVGGLRKRGLL